MRILLLLLLSYSFTFSQSITLKGKITDSSTGLAIQGAIIFIPSINIVYTNSEGEFEVRNLDDGIYTVRVSHIGYKTHVGEIQIDNSNGNYNFSLEPSPIKLDEVFVKVDRLDKYLKDSPYSLVLADKEQIESKNFNSLSDLLDYEPGITAIRDGIWSTDISIRGLSRNNIVTIIDGTRIETANDISARLSMIDMNDIDRIEVIKGAASSIYGSGATGGIVNIISSSTSFSNSYLFSGNISIGYNSANNLKTAAGTVYNSGYFWSTKISGSFRKADDVQTPIGKLRNSRFSDYSVSGTLNIQPWSNQLIKINYQLFKAEDVGIPGAAPLFPDNAHVRYPNEKRELISAGYEIQNISSLFSKLTVRYSHQYILREVENIPHIVQNIPASGTMPPRRISVLKILPMADHNSHNFLAQTNLILSRYNLLTFGIDYWNRSYNGERFRHQKIETLDSSGTIVVSTLNKVFAEKPLPDSKFQSIGVFIQDDFDVMQDELKLSLGARIDKIDITGEETLNPTYEINNGVINNSPPNQKIIWEKAESDDISFSSNIGLKYSLTSNLDLTTSLGYAFRSPSLEERFQFIDLGNLVRLGDPELKPEKGYSADFGIRFYESDIKIISSFFYNYISDIVVEKPGTYEGRIAQIKTNIGKARLYGFDFLFNYNYYKDWLGYLTTAYVKGDDISDKKNLPQIPPLNGTIGLRKTLSENISADFSSSFYAAQKDIAEGEINTPGYVVYNLSIQLNNIEFSSIRLQVFTGVENIFDKSYRNHLSTVRGGITVEPGRNFYFRMTTSW
ncbi:MAG: TonB-dependent receptor [Ignavibacteriaceae bacterium]